MKAAANSVQDGMAASGRSVAAGRSVLLTEARALETLADALDSGFDRAIDLILSLTGRTILTGMGKSGHIARKIAATLASTGTPAFFVHPGEAAHGDLGMIGQGDGVIALSNSGSTAELAAIIDYAGRFDVPLIGMTAGGDSMLARRSDVALVLPDAPEACPLGLAPTTSTTMMLALGDALAIALLRRRGFSPEDFSRFHPGGALGQRLLTVADILHGDDAMPLAGADWPVSRALIEMTAKSFGVVGAVDSAGRLTGIVTDGDLRRHMDDRLLSRSVAEIMTPEPVTIGADALAAEALHAMNAHTITCLFVTDADRRPVGIVHLHDCLRARVA